MVPQDPFKVVSDFVDRWDGVGIRSTGATLVDYHDVLYNVDGSSPDPMIEGQNWKELLLSYGIDAPCYVTNETPPGNSHPGFSVGGHMTPNPDGHVETGADSYLMPLCFWHNHKNRDGVPFEHHASRMLRLSGFLQGEIAATFLARLPSADRHSIVYMSADGWKAADLTEDLAEDATKGALPDNVLQCHLHHYVLLERVEAGGEERYRIKKAELPST